MEKEQLQTVLDRLEILYEKLLLARNVKNERMRKKAEKDASKAIADYSRFLPFELQELFNKQVGPNSLNYQHADDVNLCIYILKELIQKRGDL